MNSAPQTKVGRIPNVPEFLTGLIQSYTMRNAISLAKFPSLLAGALKIQFGAYWRRRAWSWAYGRGLHQDVRWRACEETLFPRGQETGEEFHGGR